MKSIIVISCLGLSAIAIALRPGSEANHQTAQANPSPPGSLAFEQFEIAKGGRSIILPVSLNGRDVPFLLDTGAAKSVFDSSLRKELGTRLPDSKVSTAAGEFAVEHYSAPSARVGKFDLQTVESIHCMDLSPLRQATGIEMFGVLGVDFLQRLAVEIDFDEGKLRLFQKAPSEWAAEHEKIPLSFHEDGVVRIRVAVSSTPDDFMVDTGANVSYLQRGVFDDLVNRGELRICGNMTAQTAGGRIHDYLGLVKSCRVGSFARENIRMNRDSKSGLGMQYLARFHIRFDFPNKVAYLTKSSRFDRDENLARSGMGIVIDHGRKTIVSVERYSPAYHAGVQIGDYIESVDGAKADTIDMHELGEILTSEANRKVTLGIDRNGQAFPVTITLASRL